MSASLALQGVLQLCRGAVPGRGASYSVLCFWLELRASIAEGSEGRRILSDLRLRQMGDEFAAWTRHEFRNSEGETNQLCPA